MDGNEIGWLCNGTDSIPDAFRSRSPAGNNLNIHECEIWFKRLPKPLHIIRGHDQNRLANIRSPQKILGRPNPHRPTFQFHERLLTLKARHPSTLAGSRQNDSKSSHEKMLL
jgi:hypothetical protein